MADAIRENARAWMEKDPDEVTRATVARWLAESNEQALGEAFGSRLQFGTAGLRGPLGPGPNAMNRALVRQVAKAIADYLLAQGSELAGQGVVIGYDGRHGSQDFAEDTSAVLADNGIHSWLFSEVVPTPRLAHAVTELKAAAGVMVTASHNPPSDNGYKVYWGDGAQIVPPHDSGISKAIDALADFDPRQIGDFAQHRASGAVRDVPERVHTDYFHGVQVRRVAAQAPLRLVYTAMHGVGTDSVVRALRESGFTDVHLVEQQARPDGDFPTVAFPNPEEPGALDLAMALASEVGADLIVANDPDADRLAVALPIDGGWKQLTGNQVGCLIAEDRLENGHKTPDRLVATTIVSSRMLSRIAAYHQASYAETLTGFKWIAHAAIAHDGEFVMGYEEALGYSVGDLVRDKDGVSAIVAFADLAARQKAGGRTVWDALDDLYRRYGVHFSKQRSVTLPGSEGRAVIDSAMARLREHPPRSLGGQDVVQYTDVLRGTVSNFVSNQTTPCRLPASNVLAWTLADGSQVLARPSGTEPKIKFYGESVCSLADGMSRVATEEAAAEKVVALLNEIVNAAGLH